MAPIPFKGLYIHRYKRVVFWKSLKFYLRTIDASTTHNVSIYIKRLVQHILVSSSQSPYTIEDCGSKASTACDIIIVFGVHRRSITHFQFVPHLSSAISTKEQSIVKEDTYVAFRAT